MRGLKICLWVTGIACLSSVIGMFLPVSAWNSITEFFGVGPLPDSPLLSYMINLMCATYAGTGIYFIILALRPMKYGVLVPFSGLASVLLGVVCMITGKKAGMPPKWFLSDALSALILGALILLFWQRAKRVSKPVSES
ncbi:MAG: hypothetical protein MUO27_04235 [Sedimentisphaerales bacterium]|nr:hypothetical protein [Sedimentisphaerales bacterium]